jgi:hypothetical protein
VQAIHSHFHPSKTWKEFSNQPVVFDTFWTMRESVRKLMIDVIAKRLAKAQPVITSLYPTA